MSEAIIWQKGMVNLIANYPILLGNKYISFG